MRIHFRQATAPSIAEVEEAVEIVERKGKGHPDTICDQVMEQVSRSLCRVYRERFGAILHHNCDKGLLVPGAVERRFGGGRVIRPMRLIMGGRATEGVGHDRIEIEEIAVETCRSWFRENLPQIDPSRHLDFQVELKPGSEQLGSLFSRPAGAILGANDTSAAVGYAPLTETERLVLETERYLNSSEFKAGFPQTGEDVKVLGVRTARKLSLTVAMPLLDRHVSCEADYFRSKGAVLENLNSHLRAELRGDIREIFIDLNALDREGRGLEGIYLSVLGTSAEDADSGQVGRGNRVNGLISLNRPGSSEAAAGKNPVSHVGKIYSVLAHLLARQLHEEVAHVREVTVWLSSRIGAPVDQPATVAIEARLDPGIDIRDLIDPMTRIVDGRLARMRDFCEELASGVHSVC